MQSTSASIRGVGSYTVVALLVVVAGVGVVAWCMNLDSMELMPCVDFIIGLVFSCCWSSWANILWYDNRCDDGLMGSEGEGDVMVFVDRRPIL